MAEFVEVPCTRLQPEVLQRLLEEFASRDGTDYGYHELALEEKVSQLSLGLEQRRLVLLFDADSEHWDIVDREHARLLLEGIEGE